METSFMMQMVLLEEIIEVVTEHVMVMMVFNLLKPYMWIMLQTILLTVRYIHTLK